jgi:hypothetical protein
MKRTSLSSHWIVACSRHDMAEKLLTWHLTAITHISQMYLLVEIIVFLI